MTSGGDEAVLAGGATPRGLPWQPTLHTGEERTIDLVVVGSHGGDVSGAATVPEGVIDVCMVGGARDEQHIVGELVPAVERVSIRLDDDSELDAVIVRSNLGEVDYFVGFAPWGREVVEVAAFDRLGEVLAVRQRSNLRFWREWRLRGTKPGP